MADGFHPPLEEYLEAIWELEEEGVQVIQARLAEHLGHSAPSVSEMVRRLRTDGYVALDGRSLSLTDKGRTRAVSVVRKHRLAERLLTDVIGIPWHKTHEEACRWEHVISDEVEERLVVLLGNPATCPHGNPIPGPGGPAPPAVGPGRLQARRPHPAGTGHRAGGGRHGGARLPRRPRLRPRHRRRGPVQGARRHPHPDLDEGSIALGPGLASQLFVAKALSRRGAPPPAGPPIKGVTASGGGWLSDRGIGLAALGRLSATARRRRPSGRLAWRSLVAGAHGRQPMKLGMVGLGRMGWGMTQPAAPEGPRGGGLRLLPRPPGRGLDGRAGGRPRRRPGRCG